MLAFEDLQWADDGLLDFIEHLHRWTGLPLTIVCTARPELSERRPMWPGWSRSSRCRRRTRPRSSTTCSAQRHSAPSCATSCSCAPPATRSTRRSSSACSRSAVATRGSELPETVQALISGRLDTLHPEAKEILRDAAVVGHGFWVGALAHVGGRQKEQIERRLGELQWKELVRPHPRSAVAEESQYTFWHVLVRDVAYAQIPRAARAEKHRLTAEWIESLAPGRGDLTELLAHHYTSALEYARLARQETSGLVDRARVALRDAGEHALTVYAYPAAARFFRDALELWPVRRSGAAAAAVPARAERCSGRSAAGDVELDQARDALVETGDVERAARADVLVCRLPWPWRPRRGAPSRLGRGRATARSGAFARAGRGREQPRRFLRATWRPRPRPVGEQRGARPRRGARLDEIRAESLTFRGHARILGGDLDGIEDLEQASQVAEEASSPALVRSCATSPPRSWSWTAGAGVGRLRAWSHGGDGLRRRAGLRGSRPSGPTSSTGAERWDDALAAAESLLREDDAGYGGYAGSSVRAWIRIARGDRSGALEDSATALGFARRAKDPAALCPASRFEHVCSPRSDARRGCATGRRGGRRGLRPWHPRVLLDCRPRRCLAPARQARRPACRRKAGSRWLVAAHHLLGGSHADAAAAYAAIGARPEEARARLRTSTTLAANGNLDAAQEELERARAFYHEVGAEAYARAADSLVVAGAS